MKDASMSLGIYFEIKDAELYGGEGTTGYAATIVACPLCGKRTQVGHTHCHWCGKKLSWDREAYADRDYPHMSTKGGRRR